MTIKEVERITGISSQNIRFYEKQGLITPKRNPINAYRKYCEEEVRRIKIVKMLLMLDMPLEQIKTVLDGRQGLSESLEYQKDLLESKMSDLKSAIQFCDELKKESVTIESLNVDECLDKMQKEAGSYFTQWFQDYKTVVQAEHEDTFSFVPDGAITNKYEFTNEIFRYANQKQLDIVITKESMYPEFTLDGILYRAERNYTNMSAIPLAMVRCERLDEPRENEETDGKKLTGRQKWMRVLHIAMPGFIYFVVLCIMFYEPGFLTSSWKNIIFMALMFLLCMAGVVRNYFLYWNVDGEY